LFAFLGALILILGPAGAILEVVFGATAGRIAFPAAAIIALVGWSLKEAGNREPGPWGLVWVTCFAGVHLATSSTKRVDTRRGRTVTS